MMYLRTLVQICSQKLTPTFLHRLTYFLAQRMTDITILIYYYYLSLLLFYLFYLYLLVIYLFILLLFWLIFVASLDYMHYQHSTNTPNILALKTYSTELMQIAYICGSEYLRMILPTICSVLPFEHVLDFVSNLEDWVKQYELHERLQLTVNYADYLLILDSFIAEYERLCSVPVVSDTFVLPPFACACASCELVRPYLVMNAGGLFRFVFGLEEMKHVVQHCRVHKYLTVKNAPQPLKGGRYYDIVVEKKVYSHASDVAQMKKIYQTLVEKYQSISALQTQESNRQQEQFPHENETLLSASPSTNQPVENQQSQEQGKKRSASSIDLNDEEKGDEKKLKSS
jgi:hypothetical protein